MALLRNKVSEIPKDAIILSEEDALIYQTKVLKTWKKTSDVWPINHGGTILASVAAISGIYFNNHYRTKFKLRLHGQIVTYLPLAVIPAIMSYAFHNHFVLPSVVLQKDCPICTELRASSVQAGAGCVFPAILAPITTASLAIRYNTYDIPLVTKDIFKFFKSWYREIRPINNIMLAIFLGHALLGCTITYLEAKSVTKVNDKLMLLGYELDRQHELL